MNYWIVKGDPFNKWDENLRPDKKWIWESARANDEWKTGDRVFYWESKKCRIIGLGEFLRPNCGLNEKGKTEFELRCLTGRLANMPGIRLLRENPTVQTAYFLKSGPVQTVYPLTKEQAGALTKIVSDANPELNSDDIWSIQSTDDTIFLSSGEVFVSEGYEDGRPTQVIVDRYERDPRNRRLCIEHHGTICVICGFESSKVYRGVKDGFIHVHHLKLISKGRQKIDPKRDLIPVCPNCHAMLHTSVPPLMPEVLRNLLVR